MDHWHPGDREHLPRFVERIRQTVGSDGQGIELSIRPGASDMYEERFSYYWLVTGWSMLVFHALCMIVVVVHISTGTLSYTWLPHLAGTAIVDAGIAFMAIIYRFVLFPAPLYHSRSLSMEGMPGPGAMFGRPEMHTYNRQPSQAPFASPNYGHGGNAQSGQSSGMGTDPGPTLPANGKGPPAA